MDKVFAEQLEDINSNPSTAGGREKRTSRAGWSLAVLITFLIAMIKYSTKATNGRKGLI